MTQNEKTMLKATTDHYFNDILSLAYKMDRATTQKEFKHIGRQLKSIGGNIGYDGKSKQHFKTRFAEVDTK